MKWSCLIILIFACLACGGMLPGKITKRAPASAPVSIDESVHLDQLTHLHVLHAKYLKDKKVGSLAIVTGMIGELKKKNPSLNDPHTLPDLKEARKIPSFVSLELTIEHLSHRDSVMKGPRHSAFVNAHP